MRLTVALALTILSACSGPTAPAIERATCPAPFKIASDAEIARTPRCHSRDECKKAQAKFRGTYFRFTTMIDLAIPKRRDMFLAIAELRALDQRACSCVDAACSDGIRADFDHWATSHADTADGSASEQTELEGIAAHMNACLGALG